MKKNAKRKHNVAMAAKKRKPRAKGEFTEEKANTRGGRRRYRTLKPLPRYYKRVMAEMPDVNSPVIHRSAGDR